MELTILPKKVICYRSLSRKKKERMNEKRKLSLQKFWRMNDGKVFIMKNLQKIGE